MQARPTCPDGYFLRYAKSQNMGFTTVWLMAKATGPDGKDRNVAVIQEMDDGDTFLAFLVGREGENAIQNSDAQELVMAVCALDRMKVD